MNGYLRLVHTNNETDSDQDVIVNYNPGRSVEEVGANPLLC
jgi:hypothetical protein